MRVIGLISDTHGFLDSRFTTHLKKCDEIWHAGDIGGIEVAEQLKEIAPLKAVASLTCISASPLVLIAMFPTKYALKLVSGMFTFCPNPIIGKQSEMSSSFFILIKQMKLFFLSPFCLATIFHKIN